MLKSCWGKKNVFFYVCLAPKEGKILRLFWEKVKSMKSFFQRETTWGSLTGSRPSLMQLYHHPIGYLTQWWANIIKWTQINIWIYSDGTLCTERIAQYIWMQHIYRTNIRIYSYSRKITNMNTNNIQESFYWNICTHHWLEEFFKSAHLCFL